MLVQAPLSEQIPLTDTWVAIAWEHFIQLLEQPQYQNAKAYYHNQGSVHKIGSDQPEILIISLIFWDLHKNLNAPPVSEDLTPQGATRLDAIAKHQPKSAKNLRN